MREHKDADRFLAALYDATIAEPSSDRDERELMMDTIQTARDAILYAMQSGARLPSDVQSKLRSAYRLCDAWVDT